MKTIPRKLHGILDYLIGVLLIAAPWVLGFADEGPATYTPVILGVATLLYSALTNYELGLIKIIPFHVHMVIDVLSGALLAASPWLFGFADRIYWPHLLVGIIEILTGIMTRNVPASLDARTRVR